MKLSCDKGQFLVLYKCPHSFTFYLLCHSLKLYHISSNLRSASCLFLDERRWQKKKRNLFLSPSKVNLNGGGRGGGGGERDQLEAAVFLGFLNPGTGTPQQTPAQSSKDLRLTLLCQTLCSTFQGPVSVYTDDIFGGFSWTDCEILGLITIKLLDPEHQIPLSLTS